jgi:hypothetical protein
MSSILQDVEKDPQAVKKLSIEEKEDARVAITQQIAQEVLKKIAMDERREKERNQGEPSFLDKICCCVPESFQQYFDLTTSMFWARTKETLMFWHGHFYEAGHEPQQEGAPPESD